MKISSVKYAVNSFADLKDDYDEVVSALGLHPLTCLVRQHYMDVDRGWAFFDIGLDEVDHPGLDDAARSWVFWGKLSEVRGENLKQVQVFLDPETIDSLEFEIYDPPKETS